MTEMHNKGNIKNIAPVQLTTDINYDNPPLVSVRATELCLTFIQISDRPSWSALSHPVTSNTRPDRPTFIKLNIKQNF